MVVVRVDDILVSGKLDADNVRNLDSVIKRLSDAGLKLKRQKYKFVQPSVEYLIYLIVKEGIHPMARKVHMRYTCSLKHNRVALFFGHDPVLCKVYKGVLHFDQPPKYIVEEGLCLEMGIGAKSAFVELKKKNWLQQHY